MVCSLKRAHVELGGEAPVVVFEEAGLEVAAEGIAMAGYFNAGLRQDDEIVRTTIHGRAMRIGKGPHRRLRVSQHHILLVAEMPHGSSPATARICRSTANTRGRRPRCGGRRPRVKYLGVS